MEAKPSEDGRGGKKEVSAHHRQLLPWRQVRRVGRRRLTLAGRQRGGENVCSGGRGHRYSSSLRGAASEGALCSLIGVVGWARCWCSRVHSLIDFSGVKRHRRQLNELVLFENGSERNIEHRINSMRHVGLIVADNPVDHSQEDNDFYIGLPSIRTDSDRSLNFISRGGPKISLIKIVFREQDVPNLRGVSPHSRFVGFFCVQKPDAAVKVTFRLRPDASCWGFSDVSNSILEPEIHLAFKEPGSVGEFGILNGQPCTTARDQRSPRDVRLFRTRIEEFVRRPFQRKRVVSYRNGGERSQERRDPIKGFADAPSKDKWQAIRGALCFILLPCLLAYFAWDYIRDGKKYGRDRE